MKRPGLDFYANPPSADCLVVLAHGGHAESTRHSQSWWPPLLRMLPFARVASAASPQSAVALVRYRLQGWNGSQRDAAVDLLRVLEGLPRRFERVLLVGHSMGGRAVVHAGAHPRVVGVCALAPWLPPREPLSELVGRRLVFAHGTSDTVTDHLATGAYVSRCREQGWPTAWLTVPDERHNLLRRAREWNDLVGRFVLSVSGGTPDPLLAAATSTDLRAGPMPVPPSASQPRQWEGVVEVAAASVVMSARRRSVPQEAAVTP